MKNLCKLTREKWEAFRKGTLPTPQEEKKIAEHLRNCSACREFSHGESLSFLIQEASREMPPDPSPDFFTHLERKLATHSVQGQKSSFTEIVLARGWKLVPVMTAIVIVLISTLAYQYTSLSQRTVQSSLEERILFEDAVLEENEILAAIVGGEVRNGEQ
jgi:predicted anti-sigma-YlaC factor YlaD